MAKLGRRALVLLVACLSMFVIAACGDDDDDGGGGGGGGEAKKGGSITISQTSQPDFLDPALSYTLSGWEPMWLVYTPPLTYRRAEGEEGSTLRLQQAETLVEAAIEECERFYPVFQFVLWAGKTPQEAIAAALIETQGEA